VFDVVKKYSEMEKRLKEIKSEAMEAGVTEEAWEGALKRFGKKKSAEEKIDMLMFL
jgi:hypothetical protein